MKAEDETSETIATDRPIWNIREVRIRLPRPGISALKQKADADGVTVNALIARYIDQGLVSDGRPGLFELSAWFRTYLRRKGGRDSEAKRAARDDDFT
ncbi:hypothetical protein [Devosia ginsengisoli]|uniref:hypothetical protein n=1 Tax=Devosia ginsengisoli TaxID=400770 RepID=UPI0026EB63FA|nr:hypothetical protein [Devosia ginsengisoli]MCR6670031.1 hypothetical protein [Devosia ginsengisoli]